MFVLLIASAVILGVLLAELAARWAIRRFGRYFVWLPRRRLELELHPDVHPALSSPIRFEINSDGERGSEPPRGKGVYRVLIAGSSTVECNLLDQDRSWPAVLQRLLQRPDRLRTLGARRVHVGNIAKSFVDASLLYRILLRLLPQYPRLDLIVIMVGGLEASRWFVSPEAPDPEPGQPQDWYFDKTPAQEFEWGFKRMALRELAARVGRVWFPPLERQQNVGAWLVRARTMRARARELREDVPDPSPMLDAFERDLRLGIELAARYADRVLVLRPMWYRRLTLTVEEEARFWHGGAGWVQSQEVSTFYSHESWYRLMTLLDERTVRASAALRVQHVDPLATIEPSFQHLYDHAHLTPAGAARLAEVVERAICGVSAAPEVEPFAVSDPQPAQFPVGPVNIAAASQERAS
jgi:hypothetical protein